MKFLLWFIAVIIGFMLSLLYVLVSFAVIFYGAYRGWNENDYDECWMPYYPILFMHERFKYKEKIK